MTWKNEKLKRKVKKWNGETEKWKIKWKQSLHSKIKKQRRELVVRVGSVQSVDFCFRRCFCMGCLLWSWSVWRITYRRPSRQLFTWSDRVVRLTCGLHASRRKWYGLWASAVSLSRQDGKTTWPGYLLEASLCAVREEPRCNGRGWGRRSVDLVVQFDRSRQSNGSDVNEHRLASQSHPRGQLVRFWQCGSLQCCWFFTGLGLSQLAWPKW